MATRETVGMVQDAARHAVDRKLELLEAQAEELLSVGPERTAREFWEALKGKAGIK